MPKGSHGASYARPGERETNGKIKERVKRKRRKRRKEPAEDVAREGQEGEGEGGERTKYLRGNRNDRDPGRTGIFSLRCIDARKNGVKAPLSPFQPPRRHVLCRFPCPFRQPRCRTDGPNSGEKAERGVSSGGEEQERADSRGRETFQSLVASLLACLFPRSLVCSPLAKSPS